MNKKGFSLISVLLSIAAFSIITLSIVAWYISMTMKETSIQEDLQEMAIAQDRLIAIQSRSSAEIKEKCKNKNTVNEKYKDYLLEEKYYREIDSSKNINNKVKITVINNWNKKKYSINKSLLTERGSSLVNPDSYVKNMSDPKHSLSVNYDEKTNSIKYYVDGEEVKTLTEHSFEKDNGYARFDNGLVLQWGKTKTKTIIFPKPFPNDCLNIISNTTLRAVPSFIYSFDRNQATVETFGHETYWTALGY